LLPDTGRNYLSKFYSDAWMVNQGFVDSPPAKVTAGELVESKPALLNLISIDSSARASFAAELMGIYGISQVPVIDDGAVVGSLNEVTLFKLLHDGVNLAEVTAGEVMGKPMPVVDEGADIAEVYRLLLSGHGGVLIARNGRPFGFIARIDLVNFWGNSDGLNGGGI
ncbi:MAG: CBS domain-containing protein, partial [Myxococcota bacterium]